MLVKRLLFLSVYYYAFLVYTVIFMPLLSIGISNDSIGLLASLPGGGTYFTKYDNKSKNSKISSEKLNILLLSLIFCFNSLIYNKSDVINSTKNIGHTLLEHFLVNHSKVNLYMENKNYNITKEFLKNKDTIDIIYCNHTNILDFALISLLLHRLGINNYNFILKDSIGFIPGIGFYLNCNSDIKISRSWDKDKDKLDIQLDNIINNEGKQVIIIFPEGTRKNDEKLRESKIFSQNNDLPVYNNLLVPKSKGLWFIINKLKEKNKLGNIWDLNLIVPNMVNSYSITSVLNKDIGNVYYQINKVKMIEDTRNYEIFKNYFLELWINKDNNLSNNIDNYYRLKKDDSENGYKILILLSVIISVILLANKSGRIIIFLLVVLIYLVILFKFIKSNIRLY